MTRLAALAAAFLAVAAPTDAAAASQAYLRLHATWTLQGSRHLGVGLEVASSWVPLDRAALSPDLGLFLRLRFTRLAYPTLMLGGRGSSTAGNVRKRRLPALVESAEPEGVTKIA